MKYKLIGLFTCFVLAVCAIVFSTVTADSKVERYHQHMEKEGYTPCGNCEGLCSHLPLVKIDTEGQIIPGIPTGETDAFGEEKYTLAANGEEMINVEISVYDSQTGNNHLTDTPAFTSRSLIRVRGHASRHFEKQPYLLKFVDESGLEKDVPVMGMDAHNEWILNGPYLDKSLVRNYMFYNISGEIMDYAPNVRYCEVVVNGDYRGLYLMAEGVTSGQGSRLNLTVTEKGNTMTGYLLRLDRPTVDDLEATRNIFTLTERRNHVGEDISIRYPGKTKLTQELAREIELEFAQFEKIIYSYDYDSDEYGYENYVDTDNFADYFLINEFTKNMDAGRYSTYIYKQPGGKYRMCVWDFNNACDNFPADETGFMYFGTVEKAFFTAMMRDKDYVEKVIKRYRQLRKSYLSDEYVQSYISDTLAFLGPAVSRNNERWSSAVVSDILIPAERNIHSHQEAVEQLRFWLTERAEWLDENIESLRQYYALSKAKMYKEFSN